MNGKKIIKYIEKKILPEYSRAVKEQRKNFEIRKDEGNIQVGDILVLAEWDRDHYTGEYKIRKAFY